MTDSTPTSSLSQPPANPRKQRPVTIGPVDSKHPGFDKDLRDYLRQQGFASSAAGVEWRKTFDNDIAAEVAIEAVYAHIGRLVIKHAPQLPNISML